MSYGFEGFGGGFSNPLIDGNSNLVVPGIQSPNFSIAGQTGWAILQNGDAYFFNITAQGTITATKFQGTDFIIDSAGAFFYAGTPMAGNLIGTLTTQSGVDAFGNAYDQGFMLKTGSSSNVIELGFDNTGTVFNGSTTVGIGLFTGTGPGDPTELVFKSGAVHELFPAVIENLQQLSGTYPNWTLTGPSTTPTDDSVYESWWGSTPGLASATWQLRYVGNAGIVDNVMIQMDTTGVSVNGGTIYAVRPGTGTITTPALPEIWHAATLAAGFTTNAADQAPRYRLEAIDGGVGRLDGVVYSSGAVVGPAVMFTLPVGYRPTIRKRYAGFTSASGYTTPGGELVQINPGGSVTVIPSMAAAGEIVVLDGITFPIN